MENLNTQQRNSVICDADIVFVNAGPGTGKTHLLTSKLIHVIQTSSSKENIVALSYTNTAAHELEARFQSKLKEYEISRDFNIFSGTIHSFCLRMIREYYREFNYIILDSEELHELAQDIFESLEGAATVNEIMDILKSDKCNVPESLYESVCRIKESLKVISIQDILLIFLNSLEDERFQEWIRPRITMMAIDEAQDLSRIW